MKRCDKCIHYSKGVFRINPPVVVVEVFYYEETGDQDTRTITKWPTVDPKDWCSKFQRDTHTPGELSY